MAPLRYSPATASNRKAMRDGSQMHRGLGKPGQDPPSTGRLDRLRRGKPIRLAERARSQGHGATAMPLTPVAADLAGPAGTQKDQRSPAIAARPKAAAGIPGVARGKARRMRFACPATLAHDRRVQVIPGQRTGVTRHTVFDRSSATMRAPCGSTVTPTGRPRVMPSLPRKPETKSTGSPAGRPSRNGTNTTL